MEFMVYVYLLLDDEKSVECYLCLGASSLCFLNTGFVVALLLLKA